MKVRIERINAEYQRAISEVLRDDIRDPRIRSNMVSITGVQVTSDLMHAKVFASIYGDEESVKKAMEALRSSAGFIARAAGDKLSLRRVPQLHFELDTSIEHGARLSKLIDEVVKKDEGNQHDD